MSEASAQERTEPATPRRLQKAREEGQVAQSKELASVALLIGVAVLFRFVGPGFLDGIERIAQQCWSSAGTAGDLDLLPEIFLVSTRVAGLLAGLFLTVMVLGVVSSVLQVGWMFNTAVLVPRLSVLDLSQGVKRLFGQHSLAELALSILKSSIAGGIAYVIVRGAVQEASALGDVTPDGVFHFMVRKLYVLLLAIGGVMVVPATLDLIYQRWQFAKRMRMTKQEIRDEARDEEGDPSVKGRVRAVRREILSRRSLAQVPKADVVLTNPTHLAVALKYESGRMSAPRVVAKGSGTLAIRIRQVALEHNVPVLERPPLARWLYQAVPIGAEIPETTYKAVAEILAFVYRTRGRRAAAGGGGGGAR